MPKRKKRKPAVPLVESVIHVEGVTYQRRRVRCGKARCKRGCRSGEFGHGPYWYAFTSDNGKTRAHYVGKELPRVDEFLARPEMA